MSVGDVKLIGTALRSATGLTDSWSLGWKVIGMDVSAVANPSVLVNPPRWLVFGTEWAGSPDDLFAESAVAIAPGQVPLSALSRDARNVVQLSVALGRRSGHRTVFFSDMTALLHEDGQSWPGLGIDWERALRELQDVPLPALFLSLSHRAHVILCWSGRGNLTIRSPGCPSGEQIAVAEREAVRAAITEMLVSDWAPYIEERLAVGAVAEQA